MNRDEPGVGWLLQSKDPSVRYFTLTDILGESESSSEVIATKRQIPRGPRLRALLSGPRADGGFGVSWYKKWAGPHWRLVSAVELGVPPENPVAHKAANYVLSQLPWMRTEPARIAGRSRLHASVLGNPVGVCCRLGMADDARVKRIAQSLVRWQWPDGGWNCDSAEGATHSSFYESLATLWGLNEYRRAVGDDLVGEAVDRAADFFLKHRLFRSCKGDRVVDPRWVKLHYPVYWHYDILQALRVLDLAGKIGDPRAHEALDLVESKRSKDGTWHAEGRYWRGGAVPGPTSGGRRKVDLARANTDVVDWGADGPNEMITLNAFRVLVRSGSIS